MTPLHPLAWALLGLALPLFVAYLWRKRIEARRVGSILLLKKIAVATEPPRRGISKPKHLVSFALSILALAAAALAVADVRRGGEEPHDVVVVLDTSASMGALDGDNDDSTRLAASVKKLAALVGTLHSGDRIALVTTGQDTAVRVGLTEDYGKVLAIARSVTTGGTSDRAKTAIALADGICAHGRDGRVVLFSDGVGVGVPATKCKVEFVRVGRDSSNAGISELSVREGDAFGLSEVHVAVTSDLDRAERAEVSILAGKRVVEIAALDLPARGKVERLLRIALPAGAEVSAELKVPARDTLPDDDTATVDRVEGGRVTAMLVTDAEKSFTAEALRLHPRVDLTVIKPEQPIPDEVTPDLLVLEAAPRGGDLPKSKRVVAFGTAPEVVGLQPATHVDKPELLRWAFQDPLFRYVDLQGVKVPAGDVLTPRKGQRTLIEAEQGALGLLDKQDDREVIYLGFAPDDSDLVLRVGFVNFVANLVEWASHGSSVGERKGVLSATESSIAPPDELEGANVAERSLLPKIETPLWRAALLAGFALALLELLVQTVGGTRRNLVARLSAWRGRRRARARQEDKDIAEAV